MSRTYYVYILASTSRVLYTGMTNNLVRRVWEHGTKQTPGFTLRYNVHKLVWFEVYGRPANAIAREKQIKGWRRSKKLRLIASANPQWRDLMEELR